MSIKTGDRVEVQRVFTQEDFNAFAELTGDDNPIHVDPEFASSTRFGRTLAHGMMLFSTISAVLNTRLPGPGTVLLDQSLKFPGPTFTGDQLTVYAEVSEVSPDGRATLNVGVFKKENVCCEGQAFVQLPEESS